MNRKKTDVANLIVAYNRNPNLFKGELHATAQGYYRRMGRDFEAGLLLGVVEEWMENLEVDYHKGKFDEEQLELF